ncbi:MAG TPA: MBL fold metallo-hydrolase [Candidatus Limnocylindria bacterium]|jgi:L-ascorbate metabolism protein UlaG (beta-lactamase superfamily)|nr:MBL fold metallo-hydrolase [Candidatus Limnocylindria bacterium]
MRRIATATGGANGPISDLRALDVARGTFALWWLGQAGFAVRAGDLLILLDPFLARRSERLTSPAFDPADAVDVDVVTCSHEHYDHMDLASLPLIARASAKARFVVPQPLVPDLVRVGVPAARIIGARSEEPVRVDGVTFHPLPARHGVEMGDAYSFGRELSDGLDRYLGYVVDDGVARVYHAGDTIAYPGLAARLRELDVDVALLPINGRDHFRESAGIVGNLDHREAAQLAVDAGVSVLVPMHYDTFAANRGYPAHLVDVVVREQLPLTVLIPTRDRPVLYTKGVRDA